MSGDISSHVSSLCDSGDLADVTLVARTEDGKLHEFPSHMMILARSKVLHRMLAGSFVESESRRAEIPVAQVRHLEMFRRFLYVDRMQFCNSWTVDDMLDVWLLCDKYEVVPAAGAVAESISDRLRDMNLADVQSFIDRACATALINSEAAIVSMLEVVKGKVASSEVKLIDVQSFIDRMCTTAFVNSEGVVRSMLAVVIEKVQHSGIQGKELVHIITWLRHVQMRTKVPAKEEARLLLNCVNMTNCANVLREPPSDSDEPKEFLLVKMMISACWQLCWRLSTSRIHYQYDASRADNAAAENAWRSSSTTMRDKCLDILFPNVIAPEAAGEVSKQFVAKKQRTE